MKYQSLIFSVILVVNAGCSDGNSTPVVGSAVPDNSILGLWNLNPTAVGNDESAFFEVTSESIVYYTYQGENSEGSKNCYAIDSEQLEHVAGSTFFFVDRDLQSNIQATQDSLTISFIDEADDDGDGDTNEEIVEMFPRVENINSVDLIPCQ